MITSAERYAEHLLEQLPATCDPVYLQFGDRCLCIEFNDERVGDELRRYFHEYVIDKEHVTKVNTVVHILQSEHRQPDVPFIDWYREGGKSGRKDAFCDFPDGRLLYKVRTGMNYVQTPRYHIAYGPCFENPSQIVNFILTQHMTFLQNIGCVICHSSAIASNGAGVAFAAFSGGGKSTLSLKLMNHGLDFVSNDRLFVRREGDGARMYGVAKQPRINPGTILNNGTLTSLISEQRQQQLRQMEKDQLWQLEEKYDAHVPQLYGPGRFKADADMHSLVILNWSHDSAANTQIKAIDLKQKPQLLDAVMKSPGPFHYDVDGKPWGNGQMPEPSDYLDVLSSVDVYEIGGKVDFEAAQVLCMPLFE